MDKISQEYVGAIVLLLISLLKGFGIEIQNDVLTGIVTGGVALWIAFRRYQKKDINPLGFKK